MGCVLLGGVAANAASAEPLNSVVLTATAPFPGVAEAQRFRVRFSSNDLKDVTVISRPDPATLVIEDRPVRLVRRHGKTVRVAAKPCARGTFSIGLQPGAGDPLALAHQLLPQAQEEAYVESTADPDDEGGLFGQPGPLSYSLFADVAPDVDWFRGGNDVTSLVVFDWESAGLSGRAFSRMRFERLRRSGPCGRIRPRSQVYPNLPEAPARFINSLWRSEAVV